jgi:penicillin-binding protein 1B
VSKPGTGKSKAKQKRKPATPKKGSRKTRKRKGKKKFYPMTSYVIKLGLSLSLGLLFGTVTAGGIVYNHSLQEVRGWLAPEVDSPSGLPGRVWSAPMEWWPSLGIGIDEAGQDLQAAGYARVDSPKEPGDFRIHENENEIELIPRRGNGTEVLRIHFTERQIERILDPKGERKKIELSPMELGEIRGGDNRSQRRVRLEDLPEHVYLSILAVEDSRFFHHQGVDLLGVVRAVVINFISDSKKQGASTITQQLVKNLILNNAEKTYQRKAREAIRAVALERVLAENVRAISPDLDEATLQRALKKEIIEIYLNEVYLGQSQGVAIVGVDQAARVFFGKPSERLSVGEAATLAGIISSPNAYSPLRHPERAQERRNIALNRMVAMGDISREQADGVSGEPLKVHHTTMVRRAPWFQDHVLDQIAETAKLKKKDLQSVQIFTTLQPALQRVAERAVEVSVEKLESHFPQATGAEIALVAVRASDGAIVAMVGGRGYGKSQFNRSTMASRQVGSISKPLLSAFAMDKERSIAPGCWLKDEQLTLSIDGKTWTPKNYDGHFSGQSTLRQSIVASRNIPMVNLFLWMQARHGDDWLSRAGESVGLSGIPPYPATSLGAFSATPLQMASAYALFPNLGLYQGPSAVLRYTPEGGEVQPFPKSAPQRVVSPHAAWMALDMMSSVVTEGTGQRALVFGANGQVAGKTGTTNKSYDAWFVGFDSEYVVAVWVGFDKGKALGLSGGQAAIPTWARFMGWSGAGKGAFQTPPGVEEREVCSDFPGCENMSTDWFNSAAAENPKCVIGDSDIFEDREVVFSEPEEDSETEGFLPRIFPFLRKKSQ